MEKSMHLEKLDLLEKELGRLIEQYERLREENELLRQRLESDTKELSELKDQIVAQESRKRTALEALGRIGGVVEKLEALQNKDVGESA